MADRGGVRRCEAIVEIPEELRLRRGHGFRRHYVRRRCERAAGEVGLCWQHARTERERERARRTAEVEIAEAAREAVAEAKP
jgi:hypothetical protein